MKISLHLKIIFYFLDFIPSIWLAPEQTAVTIWLQSLFDRGHYLTAVTIRLQSLFDRGHYLTAVTIWLQSLFDRGHYLTAVAYLTTVTNPKKYLEIRQFVYID